jgi:hypothetical protein
VLAQAHPAQLPAWTTFDLFVCLFVCLFDHFYIYSHVYILLEPLPHTHTSPLLGRTCSALLFSNFVEDKT